MRTVEVFKENGIFIIRHFVTDILKFDQSFEDEAIFLGALGSFFQSATGEIDVKIEKEIAPIVISFLMAAIVEPKTLAHFGKG